MNESLIATTIVGVVVSVIGWLLNNKDKAQEQQIADLRAELKHQTDTLRDSIKLLFQKHDEDVQRLRDLELNIAQRHYQKGEMDSRFEKLEIAVRDAFNNIGAKIDHLSSVLMNHITNDDRK